MLNALDMYIYFISKKKCTTQMIQQPFSGLIRGHVDRMEKGVLKNLFFDIRGAFTEHCNSNIQRWRNEFKMSGANTWIDPNEVQNVM